MLNQRVTEWFKAQRKNGVRQVDIGESLGLSKQIISQLKSGKGSIGLERVVNLLNYDKNLNPRWLILGEGNMYEKANSYSATNVGESFIDYKKSSQADLINELRNQLKTKDDQIKFLQQLIDKKL